jgi:hypothetical protein
MHKQRSKKYKINARGRYLPGYHRTQVSATFKLSGGQFVRDDSSLSMLEPTKIIYSEESKSQVMRRTRASLRKLKLEGISFPSQQQRTLTNATKTVVSTLGILVGLAGIEHGFFETLQGNVASDSIMINAIGPVQRFWEYGTERALTIIPNFFVTGILAIAFGLLVTIWAYAFVDRRYGAGVLMLLSVILWLLGGGFAPIFMSVLASIIATRINKPLNWWRVHLLLNLRGLLAKLWAWSIVGFVLLFLISVEIAIFGYPLLWFFGANVTYAIQNILAFISVGLMPVSIVTAFAHDIQRSAE